MKTKISLGLILFMVCGTSFANSKGDVLKLFKSDKEKTTKDAVWANDSHFRVGVLNDGSNREGYAKYVCSVLIDDYNIKTKSLHVGVYDIAKLANNKKWIKIGEAYCN